MIDSMKVARTIRPVLEALIRGDYAAAEVLTGGQRLTAAEMEQAIVDYGRTLVHHPVDISPRSIVDIEPSAPEQWSVYVDLWTAEEGRSDLTLELTLTESSRDSYDVQIDNIHVL